MSIERKPSTLKQINSSEDIIRELGRFGKYQFYQYAFILLPVFTTAMFNSNFIFITRDSNYKCKVPVCETNSTLNSLEPQWMPKNVDIKCRRPAVLNASTDDRFCFLDPMQNNSWEECTEWIHENPRSFVSTLNLECASLKRSLIGTIHYAGNVLSMPLMGFVSDRIGRKKVFITCAVGGSIGMFKAFVDNYYAYAILEFLESSIGAATYTTAFVLMVELCGKEKRYLVAALNGFAISLGEVMFGFISSLISEYRKLILITYIPALLYISYIFFIDESIRWLLTTGRNEKARDVILKAAKCNKKQLSNELLRKLENPEELQFSDIDSKKADKINIKELVTSKIIIVRLFIAIFWWFSAGLVYYGLLVYSVHLPGDEHQNFMMAGAVGILGDIVVILCLNRYGRKKTLVYSFMICAICTLGNIFTPQDKSWLIVSLFLIGMMFTATAYSSVYTYASELFPTQVRSLLVGISSMFGGLGSITAPLSVLLTLTMPQLPYLIFGLMALLSGFLAMFTPETLNKRLPDTIKEAEQMKL